MHNVFINQNAFLIHIWKMKPNQWFYLYYIYSPFFAYSYEESEIHEAGFMEDNFSDAIHFRVSVLCERI